MQYIWSGRYTPLKYNIKYNLQFCLLYRYNNNNNNIVFIIFHPFFPDSIMRLCPSQAAGFTSGFLVESVLGLCVMYLFCMSSFCVLYSTQCCMTIFGFSILECHFPCCIQEGEVTITYHYKLDYALVNPSKREVTIINH